MKMDNQPMRRVSRDPLRPPTKRSSNPIGAALGFLVAGIWALLFAHWVPLPGWWFLLPTILGFLAIFVAFLLIGASIGDWMSRR